MAKQPIYVTEPFSAARRVVVDAGRWGVRRHVIHGLLELDVTPARQILRAHKARTGESLSFTGWIVACFAQAIDQDKRAHAYRNWRNRLIVFDEVDVVTMIEAEQDGVAIPHIIRAANHKTFRQIHDEIRSVQTRPARSAQRSGTLTRLGLLAPPVVRDVFHGWLVKSPVRLKRYAGMCIVTSVGMFGQGSGWGVGFLPLHTLGLTVGGLTEKPGVVEGQIVIREYLDLTITFDHDIVDGAPAARFSQKLKGLIESGYGLEGNEETSKEVGK
jgi:pyruvate/2-oxoglutarate dehydrogenase complex dihydrolipoamide acyltransferase (E2) component